MAHTCTRVKVRRKGDVVCLQDVRLKADFATGATVDVTVVWRGSAWVLHRDKINACQAATRNAAQVKRESQRTRSQINLQVLVIRPKCLTTILDQKHSRVTRDTQCASVRRGPNFIVVIGIIKRPTCEAYHRADRHLGIHRRSQEHRRSQHHGNVES